jgi:hypothetical protein
MGRELPPAQLLCQIGRSPYRKTPIDTVTFQAADRGMSVQIEKECFLAVHTVLLH